ncbi:MAG: metallophosphoesterase [Tannerellaceae bacterium]|nr:metallophosphoesterase [Tannerellaceae bacterium]
MKRIIQTPIRLLLLLLCLSGGIQAQQSAKKVRFAFLTDIHLNSSNDNDRYNGFLTALARVKEMNVDFFMTGGDMIDISGMSKNMPFTVTDSMYTMLKNTLDQTHMTYYPTLGNHDRYFDADAGYKEGDEIFKKYFGPSYYTFEKNGVRFFVLNSVQSGSGGGYYVGEQQMEWLRKELASVSPGTPIICSIHVPVYSMYYPVVENRYVFVDVIANYKELLNAFEGYDLRLVLQGHRHLHEEMLLQNVQYITAGAVCAGWWGGAFHGTEEGFLLVEVDEENRFSWEYVEYGWEPKP